MSLYKIFLSYFLVFKVYEQWFDCCLMWAPFSAAFLIHVDTQQLLSQLLRYIKKNTTLSAKKLLASVLYSTQINVNSFISQYLHAEVNLYIVL